MNQITETEKRLTEIGRSILRVMYYEAEARLSGAFDMRKSNKAYANMFLATQSAGKLLRGLADSIAEGDQASKEVLNSLLELMDHREATGVIRIMNDGHLALNISEPVETHL
jgi:hypothetical protein